MQLKKITALTLMASSLLLSLPSFAAESATEQKSVVTPWEIMADTYKTVAASPNPSPVSKEHLLFAVIPDNIVPFRAAAAKINLPEKQQQGYRDLRILLLTVFQLNDDLASKIMDATKALVNADTTKKAESTSMMM